MKLSDFSQTEKDEFFQFFYDKFYQKNFGSLSKSDVELYVFHFFIKKLRAQHSNGYAVNEINLSDFKLACQLGITPQKIRGLKLKERLVYPNSEYDWRKQFLQISDEAKYDPDKKRVIMNVSDNWLFANIQDFLEDKGEPIEIQLNGKILQIPVPYYVDLMVEVYSVDNKDFKTDVVRKLKSLSPEMKKMDMKKIGLSIKNAAIDITTLGVNLVTMIPQLSILVNSAT
ncbi:hypothetical protein SAMN05720781_1659 [Fibrobacter sp. UWT3]|uniref:hypothetical protein n=1 Tax=Fibrobacter sp. UWT3 TaxID=1896225 RepID=UPI000BD41683|nr:hypothetical protein [Fibrobacter sp. UWT3]SOE75536.1 hypothetical protein SAMN05720781_1659 [Fibrobacter sp. UWT3]